MSSSLLRPDAWAKAPAALAIAVTALGAVLAACWFVIAGLWTFGTGKYADFVGILAIAAFLIGSPALGFRLASQGRLVLSLATTVPALLLYGAMLIGALFA
jgi:hypothetical protein